MRQMNNGNGVSHAFRVRKQEKANRDDCPDSGRQLLTHL